MNAEVKDAWVAALRSGEYAQGFGALNNGGRLCSLGVLCELAVEAGVVPPAVPRKQPVYKLSSGQPVFTQRLGYADTSLSYTFAPPPSVREWAGLPFEAVSKLVRLNDDKGCTFSEIADYIASSL